MRKSTLYKVRVPREVAELIRSLHPELKRRVKVSLRSILADAHAGKALKDELDGLWSYRVSHFRIIYRITARQQIEIVALGPRERIYAETFRLLRKDERG